MAIDVFFSRPSRLSSIFAKIRDAVEQPTDRTILIALFASLFCLNYLAQLFDLDAGERLIFSTTRTVSGAEIIGFAAIAIVLKDLKSDTVLRWWDFATVSSLAIFLIHPWRSNGALAISVLGLLFIGRNDKRLASLGQLCIGLAWIDFWGPLVMGLIGPWLLPIETALAQVPLSFFGSFSLVGNVIFGENGHDIVVLEPCSAFRNTINMAFIWLALIKIMRLDFCARHLFILAFGLVVVVLLNTARIDLMAYSYEQYVFWHLGPGLVIVKFLMLTIVLGIFYFGLRTTPSRAP
jgi:hypothetical protein